MRAGEASEISTVGECAAGMELDDVVTGHRAGPITLRRVHLQCLRELAHHAGHAEVLREQILSAGPVAG